MIELLIGMIASGKSTYAKKRASEGALIVNDDSFTMALHANQYQLYSESLKPLYKDLELTTILDGHMLGRDIIIDRPNFSIETRKRYISLASMLDTKAVGVIFPVEAPEVHAKRRFASDSRGGSLEKWCAVANFHHAHYEPPTLAEGFYALRVFNFDDCTTRAFS